MLLRMIRLNHTGKQAKYLLLQLSCRLMVLRLALQLQLKLIYPLLIHLRLEEVVAVLLEQLIALLLQLFVLLP